MTYTIETDFDWATRKVTIRIVPEMGHELTREEADRLVRELREVLNKR